MVGLLVLPNRSMVPLLLSPAALSVLVALRLPPLVPTCTVPLLVLVTVPPTVRLLPPWLPKKSRASKLLLPRLVPGLVVTVAPLFSISWPAFDDRVVRALLLFGVPAIATRDWAPVSVSAAPLATPVIAPEPNCKRASPDRL